MNHNAYHRMTKTHIRVNTAMLVSKSIARCQNRKQGRIIRVIMSERTHESVRHLKQSLQLPKITIRTTCQAYFKSNDFVSWCIQFLAGRGKKYWLVSFHTYYCVIGERQRKRQERLKRSSWILWQDYTER